MAFGLPDKLLTAGSSTETTPAVHDRQFEQYASKKASSAGPNGAKLSITAATVRRGKETGISFPFAGNCDSMATSILVEDASGCHIGLEESATNGVMKAEPDSGYPRFLAQEEGNPAVERKLFSPATSPAIRLAMRRSGFRLPARLRVQHVGQHPDLVARWVMQRHDKVGAVFNGFPAMSAG